MSKHGVVSISASSVIPQPDPCIKRLQKVIGLKNLPNRSSGWELGGAAARLESSKLWGSRFIDESGQQEAGTRAKTL